MVRHQFLSDVSRQVTQESERFMLGPSKILTVSYGTFSCTLEGFDDPFSTMKGIAEYFRDLAADDRYFGAEPPTPDAAMLQQIAEREIQRRVEAKVGKDGIVLRQRDAVSPAAEPPLVRNTETEPLRVALAPAMPAQAAAGPDIAAGELPVPEPAAPVVVDLAAAEPVVGDSLPHAPAPLGDDRGEPLWEDAADTIRVPGPAARLPSDDDSVAAKLARIRAAVAAARAAPAAEPVADAIAATVYEDDDGAAAEAEAVAAPDFDFAIDMSDDTVVDLEITADAAADATPDAVSAEDGPYPANGEHAAAFDAQTDAILAAMAEDAPVEADAAEQGGLPPDAQTFENIPAGAADSAGAADRGDVAALIAAMAGEAEPAGNAMRDTMSSDDALLGAMVAIEDAVKDSGWADDAEPFEAEPVAADPVAIAEDDGQDDWAEADLTPEPAFAKQVGHAPDVAEPVAAQADLTEAPEAGPDADAPRGTGADVLVLRQANTMPEAEPAPAGVEPQAEPDASVDATGTEADDALAATLRDLGVEDEDSSAAADAAEGESAAAMSDATDDDAPDESERTGEATEAAAPRPSLLQRARARVIKVRASDIMPEDVPAAARTGANGGLTEDEEAELLAELARVESEFSDEPQDEESGRAILEGTPENDEAAVSRLMEEANTKLEGAENRRRFSAIAHLKAAVAATVADRKLKATDPVAIPRNADDATDAYREDLSKAVRPRRPVSETASATQRPTIEPSRPAPLVLVSEQRIDRPAGGHQDAALVRPRRVSAGNLALPDDQTSDEADEDIALSPEDAKNFAEFAGRMGAETLSELLEAAAAYTATVEGHAHFSRPQILSKVANVAEDDDYSREDGLRSFGMLLRQGKIQKVRRGQFVLTDTSKFMAEARRSAR